MSGNFAIGFRLSWASAWHEFTYLSYISRWFGLVGPFWAALGLAAAHKWMGCYMAWHAMIRISDLCVSVFVSSNRFEGEDILMGIKKQTMSMLATYSLFVCISILCL